MKSSISSNVRHGYGPLHENRSFLEMNSGSALIFTLFATTQKATSSVSEPAKKNASNIAA